MICIRIINWTIGITDVMYLRDSLCVVLFLTLNTEDIFFRNLKGLGIL